MVFSSEACFISRWSDHWLTGEGVTIITALDSLPGSIQRAVVILITLIKWKVKIKVKTLVN